MAKKIKQQSAPNKKKIGTETANKMKKKLSQLQRKDELIESESDEPHKETMLVGMREDEEMMVQETVEEKRLKMTKQIIKDYASEQKQDFFATLQAKTLVD